MSKSHWSRLEGKGGLKWLQQERAQGRRRPGEDRYLPGLEGRGQRSFSKGPQEPTCSITLPAGGDPPCLVFLEPRGNARTLQEPIFLYLSFLYKWIHSLLAATMHNFLNILVPQFPHKMKQSVQRVLVKIKWINICKAIRTLLGTE